MATLTNESLARTRCPFGALIKIIGLGEAKPMPTPPDLLTTICTVYNDLLGDFSPSEETLKRIGSVDVSGTTVTVRLVK